MAVFVLEDLDAFAHRSKQTLLYNLLDALVTSGFQAVVLGTTCRWDCVDQLEKRVRSRFSHRSLVLSLPRGAMPHVPPAEATGLEKDCASEGALDALKTMLTVPLEAFSDAEKDLVERHNAAVEAALAEPTAVKAFQSYCAGRTSMADLSMLAESMLLSIWSCTKGSGRSEAEKAMGRMIPKNGLLAAVARSTKREEGMEQMIASLSVLELAVLIASHRCARKTEEGVINFEMTHHEFRIYSSSGDHVDNYTRRAAQKAFERLLSVGLLRYRVGRRQCGHQRKQLAHASVVPQCSDDEVRAGLRQHPSCPPRLMDWLVREGGPVTTALMYD